MNYILARLSERSARQGIAARPGALRITVRPDLVEAMITFGLAAAGLINVLFPDVVRRSN